MLPEVQFTVICGFALISLSLQLPVLHHPMPLLSSKTQTSIYLSLSQLFFISMHNINSIFLSHTYFHFLSLDVYTPFIYFSPCIIILPPFPPYLVRLQLLPAVFYSINCLISLYFAVLMHSLIGSSLPFTTISDNI
jgi:hypothetical protein